MAERKGDNQKLKMLLRRFTNIHDTCYKTYTAIRLLHQREKLWPAFQVEQDL